MKLKTKLAAGIIMLAGVSAAQATTYTVDGLFNEPMVPGTANDAEFHGQFDANWDGSMWTVSNFSGRMNAAMQGGWVAGQDYVNYGQASGAQGDGNHIQDQIADIGTTGLYMLTLDKNLQQNDDGSRVTASIFKENTSAVYMGGGYDAPFTMMMDSMKYGPMDMVGGVAADTNENAYFSLVFDHDGMGNITSLGLQTASALVDGMVYGDCSVGSLMGGGSMCMAGESTGFSMMGGSAMSLEINAVSAVPVPAAAWLFGGALMSLIGANRRKKVLPA